jgi:uncharacterized protein
MPPTIDKVLLRPGDAMSFEDRDDLLASLDRLDQPVPSRHEKRSKLQREHFTTVRYLRFLAGEDLLPLPVTLRKPKDDPPDFVLEWRDRKETFEITEGSPEKLQRQISAEFGQPERPARAFELPQTEKGAAHLWAEILSTAFLRKADAVRYGRSSLDHLLLYDLTGVGLLIPLERGGPLLARKIEEWYDREKPEHRFRRVSVLRDLALLLDVQGEHRILRRESPYFDLPVVSADGEEDSKRRLREIDRYCRVNSIRHLKLFGSILEGRSELRDDSDLDLLVEFEPGARVTLLDMARMERELSGLTGFKVDLRTAGDLSRHFREDVLREAEDLDDSAGG